MFKKNYFLIWMTVIILFPEFLSATVFTVSNSPANQAQYFSVQDAIDAAAVGDTIYIHGSHTTYESVTIRKKLVLMGAGYNVTQTQQQLNTRISHITIDSLMNPPYPIVSGGAIMGIDITSITGGQNVHHYLIENCKINSLFLSGNNWVVRNNIIANLSIHKHQTLITNNILGAISGSGNASNGSVNTGMIISNNFIVLSDSYNTYQIDGAVISNNIFLYNEPSNPFYLNNTGISGKITNCSFNNNITYGYYATVSMNLPPYGYGNTGSGNIIDENPGFVDMPVDAFSSSFLENAQSYDYELNSGSPALQAGTDGTHIGPTGGVYSNAIFNGVTQLPQMLELTIQNPVLEPGQSLNIHFKAKKND